MKQLKSIFFLVLLLLSGQLRAQEAVIEDVSFLVQFIKGDTEGTRYSVALSKSFTQSEHGRELLRRVHDYSELAMNYMARKSTVNGLEQAKESAYAGIFEVYEKNLAADKQFLAEGHITKEEFEKRKAQNEERRAALEKQMQEQLKDTKKLLGDMLNNIPDTPMPDDTEALLNELYRYAIDGKYWEVSDGKNYWGAVDKDNKVLIPLKYSYIFAVVEDKTEREFIAGEMPDYSHDELYDPETMEHVADRVDGKIIYKTK